MFPLRCPLAFNVSSYECLRVYFLQTSIPLAVILLTCLYDIILAVGLPKPIRLALEWFVSPFRNFLDIEDLAEASAATKTRIRQPPWKLHALVALPLLQVLLNISLLAYLVASSKHADAMRHLVLAISWLYASLRTSSKPPSTPPYLLLIFYILNFIAAFAGIVFFVSSPGKGWGHLTLNIEHFAITSALIYFIGTLPVNDVLPGASVANENDPPSNESTMPEDSATLWQWCTFSFVEPIFRVATTRRLEEPDVWMLSPFFKHKNLFRKYLDYRDRHPSHSLIRFLITSNSLDLILDIVLELWSAVVVFICVYALQRILSALAEQTSNAKSEAYFFAFVTFVAHLSFAQVDLFQMWHQRRCYERTRGQLFCILHYKALKRRDIGGKVGNTESSDDSSTTGGADLGKIVNLMQGDAYTVALRFWQASSVVAATVRLTISLIFLYRLIGASAIASVVVVLAAYILNYPLAKYDIKITRSSLKAKDERMSGVNELFQNIRFLKFYGWENHWANSVRNRRDTELKWRVKENIFATFISFIWIWVPSAMALVTFMFYTKISGGTLTVSKTFTALALFSMLQGPMMELPEQLFSFLRAYVSMQRINAFLDEEEVPMWASSLTSTTTTAAASLANLTQNDIGFSDATFEWHTLKRSPDDLYSPFCLGPLSFQFPTGQLSLVTGATGSGKSAMLAALLGEMHCINGDVLLDKSSHRVAYCAQNPWLEHATIRNNIIFGSRIGYDERRYETVISACALERDLAMFDARDQTEIGEKGVTLSGGQRARVALARALYSEARVILLDDPLAAVDMHTAQHIVEFCLKGDLIKGRTVVLVTHHIRMCLPVASFLIELAEGLVNLKGSITELQASGQLPANAFESDEEEYQPREELTVASPVENEADAIVGNVDIKPKLQATWQMRTSVHGKLVEAEARAEGRVSIHTYLTYIRAAGWISWFFTLALMLLLRVINIASDLFLAKWSEAYEQGSSSSADFVVQGPRVLPSSPIEQLPNPEEDTTPWLMLYTWISLAGAFATFAYIALGFYASLQASRKLFIAMLSRLIRAPSRFFDVTPTGRILNRFTSDIGIVDGALQQSARAALTGGLTFVASFLFIIWVIPIFTPFAIIIAWLYIRIAPPYIQAARDLRRLESISLSPAFSGFDELLRGLSHVRAFAMEERYQAAFYKKVDTFQSFDHVYWLVAGWLRWRYDCLGSVVVYVTTLFALWSGVSDGFAAIVIVQAGVFAEASRQLVKVAAQLELDFNSVERIGEYLQVPQEKPPVIDEKRPPAYWPSSSGGLVVDNLVVRYAHDLPPVLNSISFSVNPGEKIGVVGRTGAGKSTLALSLLRIVEPSGGKIILDGIDISTIGLEDLRTRITIVSQDVSLFTGTIRSNLDPFGEHADHECWDVLERCHLTSRDGRSPSRRINSLNTAISPNGSLSAGERQLVALARAILRGSQVIIMDEATSQIDVDLDDQIQKTIREELSSALIITIAHRLKTIIDYDRILVLGEGGRIIEFDTPRRLFYNSGGAFREMCRHSADWDELKTVIDREGKS